MKNRIPVMFFFLLLTIGIGRVARCDIALSGYFIANQECAALQSIRKNTNPGNIKLTEEMAYELISKNKADATHYRIRVKQAQPEERWVPVTCGTALVDCRKLSSNDDSHSPSLSGKFEYLLALSWQPAFCQNHQSKKECQTQTESRYDATHFTLHGLWPQPEGNVYCDVSNTNKQFDKNSMWEQLPDLGLEQELFGDLIVVMPGAASYLHRHEWIKHGTCYSETPEEYFEESMMLIGQINASAVRDFFSANIGRRVLAEDVQVEFDAAFGEGAGDKVRVKCDDGMISELWINLTGKIEGDTLLQELLRNAPKAASSCSEGIVDPVGY